MTLPGVDGQIMNMVTLNKMNKTEGKLSTSSMG